MVEQQRCNKNGCVRVGTQVMWIVNDVFYIYAKNE